MANDAEKKRKRLAEWYRKTYGPISQGAMAWLFAFRVLYHWGTFGWTAAIGTVFLLLVNSFCMASVLAGASSGNKFSLYQDLLFINWFVMFTTSAVSGSFWWTYLVVPAYGLFKGGKYFVGWIQTPDAEPVKLTAAQQKAAAKKERQMEMNQRRGRVMRR